ncbi:hypothetical protein [Salinicola halophyticus]|uniref:hypothetical protein n=1 Tax=Salinicola halophyticus TaxID=1808881 RepID=UPI000DA188F1|nr:hypothetical protein [Salinicola halophyticus]
MPERQGGSYVMKDGEPTLKHRTKSAQRKPKASAAKAEKPAKAKPTAPSAPAKKENHNADA